MSGREEALEMNTWKVVAGSPTPEELAAIVLVLGRGGEPAAGEAPARPATGWALHRRGRRPWVRPGPGGWRAAVR